MILDASLCVLIFNVLIGKCVKYQCMHLSIVQCHNTYRFSREGQIIQKSPISLQQIWNGISRYYTRCCPVAMAKYCDKINLREKALIWLTLSATVHHGREVAPAEAGENWSTTSHHPLASQHRITVCMLMFSLPSLFHTVQNPLRREYFHPQWSWVFHINSFNEDIASQAFSEANLHLDNPSQVLPWDFLPTCGADESDHHKVQQVLIFRYNELESKAQNILEI